MTTPEERTRTLVQAGAFLVELAFDRTLPLNVRREAARLARHYPTTSDIRYTALVMPRPRPIYIAPLISEINPEWTVGYKHGALRNFTRVPMPDDEPAPMPRRARKQRGSGATPGQRVGAEGGNESPGT